MRKTVGYGIVLTLLVGGLGFCYSFIRSLDLVTSSEVTAWSVDHRADCGIVLTGGPRRIHDAFEQLYLKRFRKLIISGVFSTTTLDDLFPHRDYFGDLDQGDIILEKRSLTTYGNAQQSLPLVEALRCKDVVLITSHLHMYRAYKTFRYYFPKEIPIYSRATVGKSYRPSWSRSSVEALKAVFYEVWMY